MAIPSRKGRRYIYMASSHATVNTLAVTSLLSNAHMEALGFGQGQFVCNWPIDGYMVADWIAELEFSSDIINEDTKITIIWMNGKWVNIPANDNRFLITKHGVEHHDAPSLEVTMFERQKLK